MKILHKAIKVTYCWHSKSIMMKNLKNRLKGESRLKGKSLVINNIILKVNIHSIEDRTVKSSTLWSYSKKIETKLKCYSVFSRQSLCRVKFKNRTNTTKNETKN